MLELSERIKDHFRSPRNAGEIENPEAKGTIENPVCGDHTVLSLRIRNGVIEDARFLSFGCAVTIAAASVFTEKIKGQKLSSLISGTNEEAILRLVGLIEDELGEIPPVKLHCPPATVQVFLDAIAGYFEKDGKHADGLRVRGMIPHVSCYYKRGESPE